ncbi:rho GTPase-activating protein gacO [Cimex lectularius]|uniref:Protein stum n=1 Tax=Cimex lectularius TaxID=79782 RepID=A0A8I6RW05_CIMLE|nr:rho GTPase-activating protein gacO [Cimex lectularius]
MERQQAFTVLPPLSPRLPPPPPTPAATRMAPLTVAHKENSAFVILADIGDPPSGRASPFRGRGFRTPSSPPSSRIPVLTGKSAPSSPVRSKPLPGGKSAPASPKRVNAKPPQPKRRNESPSKLPVSKNRNSPLSTPVKEPANRRLNAKPPVSKPNSPRRNYTAVNTTTNRVPQSERKNDLTKPLPAARTRFNNKPVSTDLKIGLNNKSDRPNLAAPIATARRSTTESKKGNDNGEGDKNSHLSNGTHSNTAAKVKQDETVNPQSSGCAIDNSNGSERIPNSQSESEEKTEHGEKTTANVVLSTNETLPETIHKLNKDINSVKGDPKIGATKLQEVQNNSGVELVVTKVEVLKEKAPTDEKLGQLKENLIVLKSEVEDDIKTGKSKTQEVIELKNIKERNKMVNGSYSDKEVDITRETELIKEGGERYQELKENKMEMNGLVKNKDQTLVEWTTKQPMELVQPDVIPTDHTTSVGVGVGAVQVAETTVEGPPEVEVEAGNHTVTFSSPEIHPVSPRIAKKTGLCSRIEESMYSCCRKDKNKNKVIKVKGPERAQTEKPPEKKPSIFSRLCKWKRKPRPPPPKQKPKVQERSRQKQGLFSKINCCKKKQPKPKKIETTPRKSIWRTVFCLDKACCSKCKCSKKQETKKKDKIRSSSLVGLPKLEPSLVEHTSVMKGAIPVLPICLAWFCLLLNVFLPGIGTIISGFLCMCFGKPRFTVNDSAVARLGALCVNIIVGISQIFTILFCLVGWGWSIWWGVIMVRLSRKNRRIKLAEKAAETTPAPVAVNQNHDVERGH